MDSRQEEKLNPNTVWEKTDKNQGKIDEWESENKKGKIEKSADKALSNAKDAALIATPFLTGSLIWTQTNDMGRIFAPLIIPLVPVALGIDIIKAPFCLVAAGEEGLRGGITKFISLFDKTGAEQEKRRILDSFIERMRNTAELLVHLGLEDGDELNKKCQSGDINELIGLTLLNTAYASRYYQPGLLLASHKTLERKDCPASGIPLFDAIMYLKDMIREALEIKNSRPYETNEKKDAQTVCNWIIQIKKGERLTANTHPNATIEQINTVNKLIDQLDVITKLAIDVLPKKPEVIGKSVVGLRK